MGYAEDVTGTSTLRPRVVMARLTRRQDCDPSFDLDFWAAVGPEGRFAAAWEMVSEVSLMRGGDGSQSRLQRTVLRPQRR
jgi:hypothetical protein